MARVCTPRQWESDTVAAATGQAGNVDRPRYRTRDSRGLRGVLPVWRRTGGAASCKSGDAVAEIGWAGHLPHRSMESDSVAPSSNMHFKRMADMLNACVQDSRSHKLGKDRSPMEFVNWPLANIINSLGLSFDIVGVILLFRYGLPPEGVSRTGAQYFTWGTDPEVRGKGRRYVGMSWVALCCLVVGFAVQIVSNFL